MALVGVLKTLFTGDTRGLDEAAQGALKQLNQVQRQVMSLSKSMEGGFGVKGDSGLVAFGKKALAAGAAVWGLKKSADGLIDAATKADQLAASGRAIDAVFGGAADRVKGVVSDLNSTLGAGLTETSMVAAKIGANLTNTGMDGAAAAEQTATLLKRAADMAATFGTSTGEAAAAISSALKGERDPIEAYGVGIKEAAVETEALRMGAQKVNGELSAQAKALATVNLIMAQTDKFQGASAANANTTTGALAKLDSAWQALTVSVGQLFSPAVNAAAGGLKWLVDQVKQGVDWLGRLFGAQQADATKGPAAQVAQVNKALDQTPAKLAAVGKGLTENQKAWERMADAMNAADSFQADLNRQFLQKTTGATDGALKLLEMVQGGLGADRARDLAKRMDQIGGLKSPEDLMAQAAALNRADSMRAGLALDGGRAAYSLELGARTGSGRSAADRTAKNTERTADTLEKLLAAVKDEPSLNVADMR